jgi:hypothetical protein
LVHGVIAGCVLADHALRWRSIVLAHTLLFLAGVLLGKTSLDWLYGLRGGLPQAVRQLAIPTRPGSEPSASAE